MGRAGLEAREVEQLAHEAVEPIGLDLDRVEQRAAILWRQVEGGALQALAGRLDRGQRGAEVVADRAQDRRLDGVATAERLGVEGLASELLAGVRDCEPRRQRRPQPTRD